tara:strand:+ start:102 stop:1481 length:1380 start_codon:yes stop_codon:yes gene_type:complete
MPGTTDTVKAILTPGEFVIRKEAVDMIGVPMLNMINNMPEKGGHSNIDNLIARATIENMKGMYGGGMVQAGPKPMGTGGMVDAYRGGGMVMDQYGHGGKVKNNLKPVPQGNPGLGKLPEAVRNKMGYMQEGGMVEEKMYGYQNGGGVLKGLGQLLNLQELYAGEGPRTQSGDLRFGKEGMMTREGLADMYNFPLEEASFDTLYGLEGSKDMGIDISIPSQEKTIEYRRSGNMPDKASEFETEKALITSGLLKDFRDDYLDLSTDIASDDYLGAIEKVKAGYLEMNPFEQMEYDRSLRTPKPTAEPSGPSRAEKLERMKALNIKSEEEFDRFMKFKKSMGMQQGGMVNYQNGGPVNQMPEPTADDPLQIDYRMANPEVYQGSTLGVVRQQAGALRDSIDQDTANKARKALQLLKLEGILKGEKVESPGLMPQIPSAADSSRLRDMLEYFKMRTMQNGSRP